VASQLAYDILTGLAYMNSLGFVHRNLSPNNVLFDDQVLCNIIHWWTVISFFVNLINMQCIGMLPLASDLC